jgi:hypothetical protein
MTGMIPQRSAGGCVEMMGLRDLLDLLVQHLLALAQDQPLKFQDLPRMEATEGISAGGHLTGIVFILLMETLMNLRFGQLRESAKKLANLLLPLLLLG